MLEVPMAGLLKSADGQVFSEVDDIIARSLSIGDPMIALEYTRRLQREGLLKGLAVAKMMYKLQQHWALFEKAGVGDTFDNMVETYNGYAPATVAKYIRMWESIFENPHLDEELKNKLSGRPIKDLLLLSAAAQEGSLSGEDWDRVTIAPNTQGVREVVRRARGEVTSSGNAISFSVSSRQDGRYPPGTIVAYRNGESCVLASFVEDDSQLYKEAKAKLINRAGMMES